MIKFTQKELELIYEALLTEKREMEKQLELEKRKGYGGLEEKYLNELSAITDKIYSTIIDKKQENDIKRENIINRVLSIVVLNINIGHKEYREIKKDIIARLNYYLRDKDIELISLSIIEKDFIRKEAEDIIELYKGENNEIKIL